GGEQIIVFLLISIDSLFCGKAPGIRAFDNKAVSIVVKVARAFGPEDMFGYVRPATRDLPALAEHARAIGVFEFDKVMVVNLAVAFGIAHLAAAHALGADRVGAFN